jgi:hypothetical protein
MRFVCGALPATDQTAAPARFDAMKFPPPHTMLLRVRKRTHSSQLSAGLTEYCAEGGALGNSPQRVNFGAVVNFPSISRPSPQTAHGSHECPGADFVQRNESRHSINLPPLQRFTRARSLNPTHLVQLALRPTLRVASAMKRARAFTTDAAND